MRKEKGTRRTRWLTIRLNEAEEKQLLQLYQKTTAQGLSEYARSVLLCEPVTVLYRNRSADDFLAQMLGLKTELNQIGNNFNQAVHKLHTLDHAGAVNAWALLYESEKKAFLKKTDEILLKVQEIYTLWSQK